MTPEPAAAGRTAEPPRPGAETIEAHGCPIVLRRVEGPAARELFFHCRPPAGIADAGRQADAIYRAILDVLAAEGAGFEAVASETVFLRDLQQNIEPVRAARRRVLAGTGGANHRPATTEIEQPPLDERARLEVSVQAVLPGGSRPRIERVESVPACPCAECRRDGGLAIHLAGEVRFHAAGLCGHGGGAYEQTLAMFERAEDLLARTGMTFRDVVRTWIYLRDIDRDYQDLNRARRAFFEARGIDPAPASTGIGGGPVSPSHDLCLGVYAVKGARPPARGVMTSPTLNEAMDYGADFVRGMRMAEANKVALHVSGTASIDEHGNTAHPGDFEAQAERMLVNIAALLERQGATYDDVVSATTYLKHPSDATRLRAKLCEAGFAGFPHALVAAPICRPDLLCKTEALAVLPPAATAAPSSG
jgi:enamine deaminase RidA (YjgF/YER057c/UK114 family)